VTNTASQTPKRQLSTTIRTSHNLESSFSISLCKDFLFPPHFLSRLKVLIFLEKPVKPEVPLSFRKFGKMKRSLVFALAAIVIFGFVAAKFRVSSQNDQPKTEKSLPELTPTAGRAAAFGVSAPVSSFAPAQPEAGKTSRKIERRQGEDVKEIKNKERVRTEKPDAPRDADAALAIASNEQMPAPSLTFEGLSSNDTAAAFGFRAIPPDTTGDVGLNHYVQATNLLLRVFDKNGAPLTPPFKLSQIYAPLNTPCAARDDGDPIVLYDPLADRWLLSSFCTFQPPFRQMIAVSQTGDPTGAYYVYEFVMPNFKLNDYSKFGVWRDAYFMTTDQFVGQDYAGTGAFAFDKEKMLRGEPSAGYVYFDLASPSTIRLGGMLPADLDGLTPPPAGAPGIFVSYTATEYGDAADAIKLFNYRPNFASPSLSTFTEQAGSPLAVAVFDPTSALDRQDIRQPAPGDFLDAQSDRLMYRVAYRNFGGAESLVLNKTVRVSGASEIYRAGVRLYELRRANSGSLFQVQNQATTAFDSNLSRWMASAAQDSQGNLAVGYSTSSAMEEPSIVYSGRAATDAPNTLRGEQLVVDGKGVQTAFGYRWGDYSTMSVDPADDCTFWYTNQYYSELSQEESPFGWLTRVGKFRFPTCQNAANKIINGTVTNALTGQLVANVSIAAAEGFSRQTAANGTYEMLVPTSGSYIITASAFGFQSQTVTVNIPAGASSVVQNFVLQPVAVLQNQGTEFTAESCTRNNAIEPGETVTINLPLRNTGAANAANLTATLLPTGGVTNPSQPQSYGAMPINGAVVSRQFTFTASSGLACGQEIVLTFQLQDGANNLGAVTLNFNAGAKKLALRETFDRAPLSKLPQGWTTAATGAQEVWRTLRGRSFASFPNVMFSDSTFQPGVNELVSPVFQVTSPNAVLTFSNKFDLESTFLRNRLYDGAVLEIKIGAGEFQDIEASGGVFTAGGYSGVIDGCCQNPLAGRRGWSSRSGTGQDAVFVPTTVNLPASAAGQTVQLRWRVGTDIGGRRQGQWIDNIEIADGFVCSCGN
jgi:hypothetical protein